MKKNKYEFLKNMAKATAGAIVFNENGKASHQIIKIDLNAVKMWNDSHKQKLFICSSRDNYYYDCDAFNYSDAFTTPEKKGDWFWRKGDAELLKKIAKKYSLESYEIKYNRVNTFEKHWKRCNDANKYFNIDRYYQSRKEELKQKAQERRNANEFAQFKKSIDSRIKVLGDAIQNSFNYNISNDDFYYNNVLFDIKQKYVKASNKFNKMISGELEPNIDQLCNYISLISQLLNTIDNNNKAWNLDDNAKAKRIAKACYYSNKNSCSWENAKDTSILELDLEA
jgi:hypothetical protein